MKVSLFRPLQYIYAILKHSFCILNTRAHLSRQIVDLTWTSDTNWEVMSWLLVGHIKDNRIDRKKNRHVALYYGEVRHEMSVFLDYV